MNAQTKRTPGPWYVENILHGGPRIVYGQADESGLRDDVPNTQENARLIAAAPEQHDALIVAYRVMDEVRAYLQQNDFPSAHAAELAEAQRIVRAAIAKAVTP